MLPAITPALTLRPMSPLLAALIDAAAREAERASLTGAARPVAPWQADGVPQPAGSEPSPAPHAAPPAPRILDRII